MKPDDKTGQLPHADAERLAAEFSGRKDLFMSQMFSVGTPSRCTVMIFDTKALGGSPTAVVSDSSGCYIPAANQLEMARFFKNVRPDLSNVRSIGRLLEILLGSKSFKVVNEVLQGVAGPPDYDGGLTLYGCYSQACPTPYFEWVISPTHDLKVIYLGEFFQFPDGPIAVSDEEGKGRGYLMEEAETMMDEVQAGKWEHISPRTKDVRDWDEILDEMARRLPGREREEYIDALRRTLVRYPLRPITPCPRCGSPLRRPAAKRCFACGADWH